MQGQEEYFTPTLPSSDQSQANNNHKPKLPPEGECGGKIEHEEISPANPGEVCPKRQLSLPPPTVLLHLHPWLPPGEGKSLHWGAAVGLGMVRGLCHGCPTLLPSGNSSPTLSGSPGAFGALVGVGCKWAEIFFQLRWTHWSSEVWM